MADPRTSHAVEGGIRDRWRAVLQAIDDRILRACLPIDPAAVWLDQDRLFISLDSEFKKEYCQRKLTEIEGAVKKAYGDCEVVIGEPPLVVQAKRPEARPSVGARILVLGVGDGGVNAVVRMRSEKLHGVRLVAVDADRQVLDASLVPETLQLGLDITRGWGTGGDADKGRRAALESRWEIANLLRDVDLVFVTAGLGGGIGSGAAPVIAGIAKESGALTVGVVTRPFSWEGAPRALRADASLAELRKAADVLVVISNDRLLHTSAGGHTMQEAFRIADETLHQGVRGISDLITIRGLINLDFADIRSVLSGAGEAMMGMGQASGKQRAVNAAKLASANQLLEGDSIRGARKMIMNVTGGGDLTLGEVTTAADHIRKAAGTECDLVFGAVVDPGLEGGIQITVIAADFGKAEASAGERRGAARRERIRVNKDLDVPTFLRRERERARDADEDAA